MQVLSLGTVKTFPRFRAAIVYSTLKLLQDSKVFKKRMPEDSDSPTSPGTSVRMNWAPCNALRTRHCSVTKGTVRNWLAIWMKRSGQVEVTGKSGPVLKSHLCSLLRETLKFFSKVLWSHLWGLEGGYSHHQGPIGMCNCGESWYGLTSRMVSQDPVFLPFLGLLPGRGRKDTHSFLVRVRHT